MARCGFPQVGDYSDIKHIPPLRSPSFLDMLRNAYSQFENFWLKQLQTMWKAGKEIGKPALPRRGFTRWATPNRHTEQNKKRGRNRVHVRSDANIVSAPWYFCIRRVFKEFVVQAQKTLHAYQVSVLHQC